MSQSAEVPNNRELLTTLRSLHLTDAGNAEAFFFNHGHEFRSDSTQGRWRHWNGRHWALDDTGECLRAALHTVRQRHLAAMLIEDPDEKMDQVRWALHSESAYAIKALLTSARSIKALATKATDYDRDPFLLTVGNGTINLRTGELRECRPDDLITRATDVP